MSPSLYHHVKGPAVPLLSISEQMTLIIRSLSTFSLPAFVGSNKDNQIYCFLEHLLRSHVGQHCLLWSLFFKVLRALHHQLHAFTFSKSRQHRGTILQQNSILRVKQIYSFCWLTLVKTNFKSHLHRHSSSVLAPEHSSFSVENLPFSTDDLNSISRVPYLDNAFFNFSSVHQPANFVNSASL